jgi:hypothetical protein
LGRAEFTASQILDLGDVPGVDAVSGQKQAAQQVGLLLHAGIKP